MSQSRVTRRGLRRMLDDLARRIEDYDNEDTSDMLEELSRISNTIEASPTFSTDREIRRLLDTVTSDLGSQIFQKLDRLLEEEHEANKKNENTA